MESPGKEVRGSKEYGVIVWESGNIATKFNVERNGFFCVICDGVRVRGEPAIGGASCVKRDGFVWKIDCTFKESEVKDVWSWLCAGFEGVLLLAAVEHVEGGRVKKRSAAAK